MDRTILAPDQVFFHPTTQGDRAWWIEEIYGYTLVAMGELNETEACAIADGRKLAGEYIQLEYCWVVWYDHDGDCGDWHDGACTCRLDDAEAFPEIHSHPVEGSHRATLITLTDEAPDPDAKPAPLQGPEDALPLPVPDPVQAGRPAVSLGRAIRSHLEKSPNYELIARIEKQHRQIHHHRLEITALYDEQSELRERLEDVEGSHEELIATRQMANETNAKLRAVILAALGKDDDGHTPLLEDVKALASRFADLEDELNGVRYRESLAANGFTEDTIDLPGSTS